MSKHVELAVLRRLELARDPASSASKQKTKPRKGTDEWWQAQSRSFRRQYLKDHPNSKFNPANKSKDKKSSKKKPVKKATKKPPTTALPPPKAKKAKKSKFKISKKLSKAFTQAVKKLKKGDKKAAEFLTKLYKKVGRDTLRRIGKQVGVNTEAWFKAKPVDPRKKPVVKKSHKQQQAELDLLLLSQQKELKSLSEKRAKLKKKHAQSLSVTTRTDVIDTIKELDKKIAASKKRIDSIRKKSKKLKHSVTKTTKPIPLPKLKKKKVKKPKLKRFKGIKR